MSLTGEAVDSLVRVAREGYDAKIIDVEGQNYATKQLHPLRPLKLDEPETITLTSLQGLVDYLSCDMDGLEELLPSDMDEEPVVVVHIESPSRVTVRTGLAGERAQRFQLATALGEPLSLGGGAYLDPAEMVVRLSTWCTAAGDRDELVRVIGNVRAESEVRVEDDGVSQAVTVRQGVVRVGEQTLPNPVQLAPYRTFREVEQPASPFMLRAQGGGERPISVALFEADGGTWKIAAVSSIKDWLVEAGVTLPIIC